MAYVKAGVPQHVGFALDADSDAEQPEREGGGLLGLDNLSVEAATAKLRNFIASHLTLDVAQLTDHAKFSDLTARQPHFDSSSNDSKRVSAFSCRPISARTDFVSRTTSHFSSSLRVASSSSASH